MCELADSLSKRRRSYRRMTYTPSRFRVRSPLLRVRSVCSKDCRCHKDMANPGANVSVLWRQDRSRRPILWDAGCGQRPFAGGQTQTGCRYTKAFGVCRRRSGRVDIDTTKPDFDLDRSEKERFL